MKLICQNCGVIAEETDAECDHLRNDCTEENVFIYKPTKRYIAKILNLVIGIMMLLNADLFLKDNVMLIVYVLTIVGVLNFYSFIFYNKMKTKPSNVGIFLNSITFSLLLFMYNLNS